VINHACVQVLAAMRCASWLPDYVAAMKDALPPGNPGFHPLNNGMDFRRPYRYFSCWETKATLCCLL